jgi:ubiquinol-cytochrome c reductase cytochrome c subunit
MVCAGIGPAPAAAVQGQAASPPSAAAAPLSGNAETGRLTFVKKGCYECHGREGQGSPTTGPRLGPDPVAFAAFVRAVRTPRAQMPPYPGKTLSDAELADVYAFLQGRAKPAGSIDSLVPR